MFEAVIISQIIHRKIAIVDRLSKVLIAEPKNEKGERINIAYYQYGHYDSIINGLSETINDELMNKLIF